MPINVNMDEDTADPRLMKALESGKISDYILSLARTVKR